MSIQPAQPQSIGGVLDTTFQLYKASVVKLIPLSVLLSVAEAPTSIYFFTHNPPDTTDFFAMLNALADLMTNPAFLLVAGVQMILSTWVMSAGYLKVSAIGAGDGLGLGATLLRALKRLPVLVVMIILASIVLTIAFFLLIVPGLILSVSLALCYTLAVLENRGPVEAMTNSHRLVWGNWWRTAAILTVGFIVIIVISMVAGLISGVLTPLLALSGGAEYVLLVTTIVGWVVGIGMNVLLTPFYISLPISIYWDLKLRKDGGDLAARVGALNPA
jgi:hypothetical protein